MSAAADGERSPRRDEECLFYGLYHLKKKGTNFLNEVSQKRISLPK